jgi:hypothetical protein
VEVTEVTEVTAGGNGGHGGNGFNRRNGATEKRSRQAKVSDSTARREAARLSDTIRVKTNRPVSHPTRFRADRVAQPLRPATPADASNRVSVASYVAGRGQASSNPSLRITQPFERRTVPRRSCGRLHETRLNGGGQGGGTGPVADRRRHSSRPWHRRRDRIAPGRGRSLGPPPANPHSRRCAAMASHRSPTSSPVSSLSSPIRTRRTVPPRVHSASGGSLRSSQRLLASNTSGA